MYFLALATDYDGTIARDGVVRAETWAALRRLKGADRRLLLVTGRELPAILALLPEPALFDRIIAENGAVIHDPAKETERLLAPPPPPAFVQRLHDGQVAPLSVGRCILATWEPHQTAVLEAIHDLGLELQISFNKGAVMVLPSGVNKATGLQAALAELGIAMPNVVGVGDAENDHAFLRACGCSVAVANALPMVRCDADLRMAGDHGAGVEELVDLLIGKDAMLAPAHKHGPWLGRDREGGKLYLRPGDGCALVLGPSGAGKSTLATALTERITQCGLEFCVVDPEGDYVKLSDAVRIGSLETPPSATEALRLISQAGVNVVVNTQAMMVPARQALFTDLLHQTAHLRARTGRPHWLLIDEAHELLPAAGHAAPALLDQDLAATVLITLAPAALSREALAAVRVILALGANPAELIRDVARLIGHAAPDCPETAAGEALCWRPGSAEPPVPLRLERPDQDHRRHAGKYAIGDVGEQRSFYLHDLRHDRFIRARNLYEFLDQGCMIDDRSWERHLRAGDFSAWFRDVIRDDGLAREALRVEADHGLGAAESRRLIRNAIWRRYAAPAQCP
ncbi:HAD-IIB family hydrolase [Belnapia sp. T6]|uniref:HAD-IIB family hydrolase n=1 Tax=Belnapia mucosa TaxID=2804532 RepID=A0ABS1V6S7_9PROT|nr:HAD-IIB family hydrolase [Belnapia mucosa]MBL6457379.1 HAD-IIB family hydrolase [Belnapia mucosa]